MRETTSPIIVRCVLGSEKACKLLVVKTEKLSRRTDHTHIIKYEFPTS